MLVTHHEEKLVNAIKFFFERAQVFDKRKLFQLLFLMDFRHYRQIGRSVTGLEYKVTEDGIVPCNIDDSISCMIECYLRRKEGVMARLTEKMLVPGGISVDQSL